MFPLDLLIENVNDKSNDINLINNTFLNNKYRLIKITSSLTKSNQSYHLKIISNSFIDNKDTNGIIDLSLNGLFQEGQIAEIKILNNTFLNNSIKNYYELNNVFVLFSISDSKAAEYVTCDWT